MLIRAKAPLRVSFAGGGTDVSPFPSQEGGLVLNATICQYAYGTLNPRDDLDIHVESLDVGQTRAYEADDPLQLDGRLDLVTAAIKRLGERERGGFDLFLRTSAPPGSGLGGSSTMMVALVGLLKEVRSLPLTDYDIADLAHSIERRDLGIKGGLQDHYAATFGGFNYIEFSGDRVVVNPLRMSPDVIYELEHNMLLCYTGTTRRSDHIIADQTERFEHHDEDTMGGLREQKELAVEMKNALLQRRVDYFGELLDAAWQAKKRMSARITNDAIDELYEKARKSGAIGGKITGAGGGGYMLFYCAPDRRHKVAEELTLAGAPVADLAFDFDGLRTWRVSSSGR